MPRPTPSPENKKTRTSVSLTAKAFDTAQTVLRKEHQFNGELSSLTEVALIEYAENHHPGLFEEIKRRLREDSAPVALPQPAKPEPRRKHRSA